MVLKHMISNSLTVMLLEIFEVLIQLWFPDIFLFSLNSSVSGQNTNTQLAPELEA
ncbi:hypothetical protein ACRRTK_012923 [Alexandromys fortis]